METVYVNLARVCGECCVCPCLAVSSVGSDSTGEATSEGSVREVLIIARLLSDWRTSTGRPTVRSHLGPRRYLARRLLLRENYPKRLPLTCSRLFLATF